MSGHISGVAVDIKPHPDPRWRMHVWSCCWCNTFLDHHFAFPEEGETPPACHKCGREGEAVAFSPVLAPASRVAQLEDTICRAREALAESFGNGAIDARRILDSADIHCEMQ